MTTMRLEHRQIVSIDIKADAATVWEHLREPAKVRRWFGWDYDGLDAEIRQIFVDEARAAETSAVDEPAQPVRSLTWKHGDLITVTPVDEGRSHLTIARQHDGLHRYDGVRDEMDEGWIAFAQQLRFALERHPGQDRRTLRAEELDAGGPQDRLLDRAGLHGVRGIPLGGHVEARRPDGSPLGGTLWHRTEFQVGIQLHGLTEALLVIEETPAASRPPHGLVTATLSLYGADDALVAEVERRWSTWWGARRG
ncbi:hypothetical protein [Cellulomonas sp. NS3]|uniref:hypothetical protein n=1 Tax=Cellulomonas sp. NS3 TaxID=2973977 RepID=UPI0021633273|nr:hypothetical protein [Cellulomonas sp. NS3]